jgi:pantoate--beta-alanine ligase
LNEQAPSPPPEPVIAFLGLGSNLGDREGNIRRAVERLGRVPGVRVLDIARLRETKPVGGPSQPDYLNTAARIETRLEPHALLAICQMIERELGRRPDPVRNAPRPIDLDVLLFGDRRIDSRDLVVPHPRMFEREFVLDPLRELGVDVESLPRPPARPELETEPASLTARSDAWRQNGCTVGLVPTMGALHEGHAALLRRARRECDRVIATIFVNPLQFAPGEDYDRYPRTFDADVALCAREGVDVVFAPARDDLYPPGFCSSIAVGAEAEGMEGLVRPGHFGGVATVVAKLWNLARPDRAYFGRKDAQQVAVLRRLHRDLALSGTLVECDTVREPDGLAMSSRNAYLSPVEREAATVLYRALSAARHAHDLGERRPDALLATARTVLDAEPACAVDYVELRRDDDLLPLPDAQPVPRARMLIAARIGRTRLIDNATLGGDDEHA